MSKQTAPASKVFDPVKLEQMTEPLSVRVEKVRGGVRTPIPLPTPEEGGAQGTNWSKDDVLGLEAWLVNEWSGGGTYAISVMDSTQPTPQKHEWQIFYSTTDFPEKRPPTLSAAAGPDHASVPSQPAQVRPMGSSFPSAFPNGMPVGLATTGIAAPQTVFVPQPAPAPRTDIAGAQFAAAQAAQAAQTQMAAAQAAADAERRRLEDQLKEMQAQVARAREEQLQLQHRQELERAEARRQADQQAQNDRLSKLEQLIGNLATAANTRPAVDPQLEALKAQIAAQQEQNRVLAQQAENERREREAERREREMRDMIQRQAEESRRAMEAMQAQIVAQQQAAAQAAALAAAQANKGPDPMIMFMQENARQQVEAAREQARNQLQQMQQLQAFMMRPEDVMRMAKESSNGIDQATNQLTRAYTDIFNMQRQAVETVMQMGGGGSETVALIEKGLERASSFAERFIGGKTKEAVTAQQAQAQMAQAQAAAMQAQAQAMAVQAHMQAQAAGLNGPTPTAMPEAAGPSGETQVQQTSTAASVVPPAVASIGPRRLGRTDGEWFGPLLSRVEELRAGVNRFMKSISMEPKRIKDDGSVDGVEPEQAAHAIQQAAGLVMQQQIPIAAMIDLLGQGRIADFMDVLLPDAPQPYRDEVAQLVLQGLSEDDEDEDEDEDEDDGDDGDDENVEAAAPTPAPAPARKNGARARA